MVPWIIYSQFYLKIVLNLSNIDDLQYYLPRDMGKIFIINSILKKTHTREIVLVTTSRVITAALLQGGQTPQRIANMKH